MAESSFASLSPTLLARKGGAKPAMRPQHAALATMAEVDRGQHSDDEHLEDLGWNDMGEGDNLLVRHGDAPSPSGDVVPLTPMPQVPEAHVSHVPMHLAPPQPAVLRQREDIADRIAALPNRQDRPKRASRAAFTLRLDPHRHLKLRLACAVRQCSAQAFVTEALDTLLGEMPELETLAAQVKRR